MLKIAIIGETGPTTLAIVEYLLTNGKVIHALFDGFNVKSKVPRKILQDKLFILKECTLLDEDSISIFLSSLDLNGIVICTGHFN